MVASITPANRNWSFDFSEEVVQFRKSLSWLPLSPSDGEVSLAPTLL